MSTAVARMTVAEFLALPELEHGKRELINGQVVITEMAGKKHEKVKSNTIMVLASYVLSRPVVKLMAETKYNLGPYQMPIPDISLLSPNQWNQNSPGEFEGAPEIAIEVVSSETAARLQEKIEIYLTHGSQQVWVLYPDERIVLVHYAASRIERLKADQVLEAPDVLPGFRTPVSAFFEGI